LECDFFPNIDCAVTLTEYCFVALAVVLAPKLLGDLEGDVLDFLLKVHLMLTE
jgi:hypothetical protein